MVVGLGKQPRGSWAGPILPQLIKMDRVKPNTLNKKARFVGPLSAQPILNGSDLDGWARPACKKKGTGLLSHYRPNLTRLGPKGHY